jgi:hypothetical protein
MLYDSSEESEEPADEKLSQEQEEWTRIQYDFVVADVGYHHDVVLCNASTAERYRQNPQSIDHSELGLQSYDGLLVRFEETVHVQ